MTDLKNALQVGEKSENIQDAFLNTARRERSMVTLYLMGGAKLTGKIRSFDRFSLILEANHQDQLVFKHAIATITALSRGGGNPTHNGASAPNTPAEG